jgi:hypothetical protein
VKRADLRLGDLVEVNRRGTFQARIAGAPDDRGQFPIEPVSAGVGYSSATARQIRRVIQPGGQQGVLSDG